MESELDRNALLIEDNKILRKIMSAFLHELAYTVDLVQKDKKAVKKALDNEYNLIILAISSKEFVKDEFISLVRKSKNVGTPVIAWSELIYKKNKDLYLAWGADAGLPRKCTVENLEDVIAQCSVIKSIERKFLHRRLRIIEKLEKLKAIGRPLIKLIK